MEYYWFSSHFNPPLSKIKVAVAILVRGLWIETTADKSPDGHGMITLFLFCTIQL